MLQAFYLICFPFTTIDYVFEIYFYYFSGLTTPQASNNEETNPNELQASGSQHGNSPPIDRAALMSSILTATNRLANPPKTLRRLSQSFGSVSELNAIDEEPPTQD